MQDYPYISYAMKRDDWREVCKLLIQWGADINDGGDLQAIYHHCDDKEKVLFLVSQVPMRF